MAELEIDQSNLPRVQEAPPQEGLGSEVRGQGQLQNCRHGASSLRAVIPCVALLHFNPNFESFNQVNSLCFHCPPYQFLFCPSSGCS
ncbi:hypothetical protein PAMP_012357 [Pampus punctatissimus]